MLLAMWVLVPCRTPTLLVRTLSIVSGLTWELTYATSVSFPVVWFDTLELRQSWMNLWPLVSILLNPDALTVPELTQVEDLFEERFGKMLRSGLTSGVVPPIVRVVLLKFIETSGIPLGHAVTLFVVHMRRRPAVTAALIPRRCPLRLSFYLVSGLTEVTNLRVVIMVLVGSCSILLARPRAMCMFAIRLLFLTVAILSEAMSCILRLCIPLIALVRVWKVLWWRISAMSVVTGRRDSV